MSEFRASDYALSEFLIRASRSRRSIKRRERFVLSIGETFRRRYDYETDRLRRAIRDTDRKAI